MGFNSLTDDAAARMPCSSLFWRSYALAAFCASVSLVSRLVRRAPGTAAAARMKDDVPTAVKRFRNNDLLAVQAQVGLEHHQSYIGRTMELLVEGPSTRASKKGKSGTDSARTGELSPRFDPDFAITLRNRCGPFTNSYP